MTTQGAEFMAIKRNFFRSNASLGFYPERNVLMTAVGPTGEPRQVLDNKVRVKLNEWTPPIPCYGTLVILQTEDGGVHSGGESHVQPEEVLVF